MSQLSVELLATWLPSPVHTFQVKSLTMSLSLSLSLSLSPSLSLSLTLSLSFFCSLLSWGGEGWATQAGSGP